MTRGDVVLVELPIPGGQPGHEIFGERPAVVVQYGGIANLSTTVVVPVTKNLKAERVGGAFVIQPSQTNGLDLPSLALVFQVRAIDKARIRRRIGKLEAEYLKRLDESLKALLNL